MDTHVLHGRTHRVATKDRARMDMAISLIDAYAYAYAYAYGALMAGMAATRGRWPRGWRGVQKTAGANLPAATRVIT